MIKVWDHRLLAAALLTFATFATPVAAASSNFGQAIHENLEGHAPDPVSFTFGGSSVPTTQPDDCLGVLNGGSIAFGTAQLPAVSGSQLYAGTNILFDISDLVA